MNWDGFLNKFSIRGPLRLLVEMQHCTSNAVFFSKQRCNGGQHISYLILNLTFANLDWSEMNQTNLFNVICLFQS